MTPAKRRSVYQGGKVVPEPTVHEHKKTESARSGVRRPGEPNFRPPFEPIGDPQIPVTRHISTIFRCALIVVGRLRGPGIVDEEGCALGSGDGRKRPRPLKQVEELSQIRIRTAIRETEFAFE
jgi:hypothetical protein